MYFLILLVNGEKIQGKSVKNAFALVHKVYKVHKVMGILRVWFMGSLVAVIRACDDDFCFRCKGVCILALS